VHQQAESEFSAGSGGAGFPILLYRTPLIAIVVAVPQRAGRNQQS
jgi:hypothetical protein